MMRRQSCLCVLTTLLLATLSLTAPTSSAQPILPSSNTHLEWPAQTATAEGRVRVIITKTKPRILLAKSQRPIGKLFLDDQDDDYYDDLPELQIGYRRPELVKVDVVTDDVDLTDEIKIRLAVARLKALKKYQEVWG